jgi:hypothetical protein
MESEYQFGAKMFYALIQIVHANGNGVDFLGDLTFANWRS